MNRRTNIKMTAYFITKTMKARRQYNDVIKVQKG